MLKIPFWSKETGNLMSHSNGLTPEQVEYLKQLKVGERLILWFNKTENANQPSYTMKVFRPSKKETT